MSQQDDVFIGTFKGVLIFLVVLTLAIIVGANFIAPEQVTTPVGGGDDVAERIAPVGKVKIAGEAAPAAPEAAAPAAPEPAAAPAAAETAAVDAMQVYNTACMACHATGAAGAPKTGDTAAWESRIAQGMDVLNDHAINGFKAMPAKGGRADLSNEAVAAAVEYMVQNSK